MNTHRSITILLILLTATVNCIAQQNPCTLLLITNKKAKVFFDGEEKGSSEPNVPYKILTTDGEHYAQVKVDDNGVLTDKSELVTLESGKQKIVRLFFEEVVTTPEVLDNIQVADLNFNLPGTVTVFGWQSENASKPYQYPEHYYAFEAGDEITLDVSMSNKNGTNSIEVTTYPDGVTRYSNNGFKQLTELKIKIPQRAIYRFVFATNHAFDRNCFFKIARKPASKNTASFNTKVSRKKIYTPISIHEPQDFFVNGGMKAFSTGKSRVVIPVTLPENTIEWYYRFSASRNQADIENVKSNFKLFAELTTLAFGLTAATAGLTDMAFNTLAQPPGEDYCHIYLLTAESQPAFEAKADDQWRHLPDGSRTNFKSGNVKINCCNRGNFYLGIKNPSSQFGINVSVEVVAITLKEEYIADYTTN